MMISVLCIVFIALCLLVGGDRTAKTLVTLSLNAIVMIAVIGAIAFGIPPVIVSLIAVLIVICITIFYQNEVNDKTRAAFAAVVLIASVMLALSTVFVYGGHLQGLSFVGENKIRESNGYSENIGINMFAIAILVMLWTLVGAIVDTTMAIVSGVYEIARHNPDYGQKDLIFSGMKIGGNILSSTVNTLFFIFAGEYLILFINFSMYYSLEVMINSREFAEGIINIIISAVGCIAIIPAASCLAAYRFSKRGIER